MKIDGSKLSAHALGRQRPTTGDNSLSGGLGSGGGSSSARNIPTVEPTAAMPSGLAQLPPEQREAIEEEIGRTIRERLGIDGMEQAGGTERQSVAGPQEAKA